MDSEKEYEIDVDIPKEIFEFNPPTGYSLSNTKETASLDDSLIASPFMLDSVKGKIVIILSLPNGVAIMGWHLESDKPVDERIELYENIIPGDELPKSPIEIAFDLWPKNNILDITYVNRYLAQTQKNGKFYEWGICVPNNEFNAREMSHARKISYIHHPEHENEKQDTMRSTNCQTLIIEEDKFDTFIQGAMAELSDDGIAPDYITYENIISIAQNLRH